jgi:tol-pal system protein YbgF
MSLFPSRALLLASAALAVALAAPASAQQKPADLPQPALPDPAASEIINTKNIEKRLEREEKALRELRQIVLQAKAQGNPVTVKDAGPDPDVETLKARVGDLEETLRRLNGQMEEIAHNAQLASKAAADVGESNKALAIRLDRIEQQLLAAGAAALAASQQPQAAQGQPQPSAAPSSSFAAGGVIGTLRERGPAGQGAPRDIQANPGAEGSGPGEELQAYRAARQTLDSGDYVGGASALQEYLDRYPTSPRAAEANYWLGRTLALRNMHAEAAGAYARALKGWPQASWAGDAVVRLSASLIELKRGSDACKALAEFDSRYRAKSGAALNARAKDARAQAACS